MTAKSPQLNCGDFEAKGFVVFPEFLSNANCISHRRCIHKLSNEAFDEKRPVVVFGDDSQSHDRTQAFLDSGTGEHVLHEPNRPANLNRELFLESVARIGHGLHSVTPEVISLVSDGRIGEIARQLGHLKPAVIESLYIRKSRFSPQMRPHVDHSFLWSDPPTVLLFWIALEDADDGNGGLAVDPRGPLRTSPARLRRLSDRASLENYGPPLPAIEQLIPIKVMAGDLVVVHPLLVHASPSVKDVTKTRDVLALHVIDSNADIAQDLWMTEYSLVEV